MLLYILATNRVVSAVLLVERDMEAHKFQVQRSVYYVFEVLTPCKTRYPHYQKIAYAIFMSSRKLRHYSQLGLDKKLVARELTEHLIVQLVKLMARFLMNRANH